MFRKITGDISMNDQKSIRALDQAVCDGEEWRLEGWLTLEAGQLEMLSRSVRQFFDHATAA